MKTNLIKGSSKEFCFATKGIHAGKGGGRVRKSLIEKGSNTKQRGSGATKKAPRG